MSIVIFKSIYSSSEVTCVLEFGRLLYSILNVIDDVFTDNKTKLTMGNAQARRRLGAKDFQYIANNTALLNMQIVTEYYTEMIKKYPDGKMDVEDFKKIFHLAFPERKQDKVDQLAEKLRNVEKTDGTIRKLQPFFCDILLIYIYLILALFTIAMLLFWFSDGPMDENLGEVSILIF